MNLSLLYYTMVLNGRILASIKDPSLGQKWTEECKSRYAKGSSEYAYYSNNDFSRFAEELEWDLNFYKNDANMHISSGFMNFMKNPTLKTATDFYTSVFHCDNKQTTTTKGESLMPKSATPLTVHGGAFSNAYKDFGRTDALHDLSGLSLQDFPGRLRRSMAETLGLFETQTNAFTNSVVRGLATSATSFVISNGDPPGGSLFIPASIQNDIFHNIQPFLQQKQGIVVMDSLIYRRKGRSVQNALLAAFILLCFKNVFAVQNYGTSPFSNITFVIGPFMTIDGTPLTHFANKYILALSQELRIHADIQEIDMRPSLFESVFGKVDIHQNKIHFESVDGIKADYKIFPSFNDAGKRNRKHFPKIPEKEKINLDDGSESIVPLRAYLKLFHKAWCVPYHKDNFQEAIKSLWSYSSTSSPTELLELQSTIRVLADINFLCDAWRVEVAAQFPNSLFLTSDRLAFHCFELVRSQTNASCSGICLHAQRYTAFVNPSNQRITYVREAGVHIL